MAEKQLTPQEQHEKVLAEQAALLEQEQQEMLAENPGVTEEDFKELLETKPKRTPGNEVVPAEDLKEDEDEDADKSKEKAEDGDKDGDDDEEKSTKEDGEDDKEKKGEGEDKEKESKLAKDLEKAEKKEAAAAKELSEAEQAAAALEANPHTSKKTKEIINGLRKRIADAEKAHADAQTKLQEAEKKAAEAGKVLPKELEEEVKTLREFRKEKDIENDPELVKKYDAKIERNVTTVYDTLKSLGLPEKAFTVKDKDGKAVAGISIESLKETGLTIKALKPILDKLEAAEDYDSVEKIKTLLRKNIELKEEKAAEVKEWKADYDTRQQAKQKAQEEQTTQQHQQSLQTAATELHAVLTKAGLKRDSKLTAEEAAKTEYGKLWSAVTKKLEEAGGSLTKAAVQNAAYAVLYERNLESMETMKKENEDLKTKMAAARKAGAISKTVTSGGGLPGGKKASGSRLIDNPEAEDDEDDDVQKFAKEKGLKG